MRIVILGLGSIGTRHARNFRRLGDHRIIGMDPSEERRCQFLDGVGGEAVGSLEEALDAAPDLAVVCSPNRFHFEQAIGCARAGCHLMIEKPLSTTLSGLEELVSLVESKNLFTHMGSNWKFHPALIRMRNLIQTGALGQPTGAQILAGQWLPDWHPWEDYRQMYSSRRALGGGVLLDSHEIDYLTWLLGPARRVAGLATHSGALDIETEDVAAVCLQLENGALATLLLDYIQREARRRYHFSGSEGTVEWDLRTGVVRHYSATTRVTTEYSETLADLNDMYLAQARHVLEGVTGNVAPVTPLSDAAAVLNILLALRETIA